MSSKTSVSGHAIFVAAVAGIGLSAAQDADASKRNPAPITYVGDRPSNVVPSADSAAPMIAAPSPSGRRVEFRYPDQPNVSYGAGGARTLGADAAPFAFSSSQAAITPEDAQLYSATPPRVEPPRDPSLSPGAFDARAAAARASGRVETAALGPIEAPRPKAADFAPPQRERVEFQPVSSANSVERGMASWYGPNYDGKPTASGEIFDQEALTGAHPTLPLPSLVEVTNLSNGKTLVVRINDRGPFIDGRIVDVSRKAAELLGFEADGVAEVSIRYIGPAGEERRAGKVPSAPVYAAVEPQTPVAKPLPASVPTSYQPAEVGGLVVQVGAFADIGNAEQVHRRLTGAAIDVRIKPVRVNGSDYFRVVVGPYVDRSAAKRAQGELRRLGYDNTLIRWDE